MIHHPAHRRRTAFTLVEMLVAAALIIFMMWIISTAFQKGLEAFSTLKTAGDMQEKLRGAATVIRRDLTRPHFSTDNKEFNGEDLGDQKLDNGSWTPPTEGYFRIFQTVNRSPDGFDPDDPTLTAMHYRVADASTQGDLLQFTVKQRGARRDQSYLVDLKDAGNDTQGVPGWGRLNRFSFPQHSMRVPAVIPYPTVLQPTMGAGYNPNAPTSIEPAPTTFTTTWADITYFLRAIPGETTGGVQRFALYRRQNLLGVDLPETVSNVTGTTPRALDFNSLPNTAATSNYLEISSWSHPTDGSVRVNDQKFVTAPCRRFGINSGNNPAGTLLATLPTFVDQVGVSSPLASTDLLLTDVIDFEVKALWEPNATASIQGPQLTDGPTFRNPDFPFDRLPAVTIPNTPWTGQRVFDTWSQRNVSGQPDDYVGTGPTPLWNSGPTAAGYGGGTAGPKTIPLKIRVRGVQIEMRVWDQKTQTTRQITIIQDL